MSAILFSPPTGAELPRVLVEAARCDRCEDAVCMGGCPAYIDLVSLVSHFVAQQKLLLRDIQASAGIEFAHRAIAESFA